LRQTINSANLTSAADNGIAQVLVNCT